MQHITPSREDCEVSDTCNPYQTIQNGNEYAFSHVSYNTDSGQIPRYPEFRRLLCCPNFVTLRC